MIRLLSFVITIVTVLQVVVIVVFIVVVIVVVIVVARTIVIVLKVVVIVVGIVTFSKKHTAPTGAQQTSLPSGDVALFFIDRPSYRGHTLLDSAAEL